MQKPPLVRPAVPDDERALYHLLVEMHRYNNIGWGHPYDPATVRGHIEECTRPEPSTRTNQQDQRRGIAGVIEADDKLVATIGLFVDPATWFSGPGYVALFEIWFFVSASHRKLGYEEQLRDYALWVHENLDPHDPSQPFHLYTGFMNPTEKFGAMQRLWHRLWPHSRQVGALFQIN